MGLQQWLARVFGVVLVTGMLTALGSPPQPADADGPGVGPEYVVTVGDSFISGEAGRWAGNTNYLTRDNDALGGNAYADNQAGTGERIKGCHRSRSSEAHFGALLPYNLACSGATTRSRVDDKGHFKPGLDFDNLTGRPGQAQMLQDFASTHNVRLVVVSIGGNDFKFADVVSNCVQDYLLSNWVAKDLCRDDKLSQNVLKPANLAEKKLDIAVAHLNIQKAMRNAGYADNQWTLVVQNYPSVMPKGPGFRYPEVASSAKYRQFHGGCGFWNADATWANEVLLPTISQAVFDALRLSGISNARTMDITSAFNGHRLCEQSVGLYEEEDLTSWQDPDAVDKTEWFRRISVVDNKIPFLDASGQESFHPNYWAQLGLQACLGQIWNGGAPRSGSCGVAGPGLVDGRPRMVVDFLALPAIVTASVPSGTTGNAYRVQLQTTESLAGRWEIAGGSLPAGLTLETNGSLHGVPSEPGTSDFRVRFEGLTGTDESDFGITVVPEPDPWLATSLLPEAEVGFVYQGQLEALTPMAGVWSATGLPDGLLLDSPTGLITGRAKTVGDYTVSVVFTEAGGVVHEGGVTLPVRSYGPYKISPGPSWASHEPYAPGTTSLGPDYVVYWAQHTGTGARAVFIADAASPDWGSDRVSAKGVKAAYPTVSRDGRYVAYLADGQAVVTDRTTNRTTRFSSSRTGRAGNGVNGPPVISRDGNAIVFASTSSNLVGADQTKDSDVFRWSRSTGKLSLLSSKAKAAALDPALSSNGGAVVFSEGSQVRVWTAASGSKPLADATGATAALTPSISGDGGQVVYVSARSGQAAVYLADRGTGITVGTVARDPADPAVTDPRRPSIAETAPYLYFDALVDGHRRIVEGDNRSVPDAPVAASVVTDGDGSDQAPTVTGPGLLLTFYESTCTDRAPWDTSVSDIFVRYQTLG